MDGKGSGSRVVPTGKRGVDFILGLRKVSSRNKRRELVGWETQDGGTKDTGGSSLR